jgi:hypothetical protein
LRVVGCREGLSKMVQASLEVGVKVLGGGSGRKNLEREEL